MVLVMCSRLSPAAVVWKGARDCDGSNLRDCDGGYQVKLQNINAAIDNVVSYSAAVLFLFQSATSAKFMQ